MRSSSSAAGAAAGAAAAEAVATAAIGADDAAAGAVEMLKSAGASKEGPSQLSAFSRSSATVLLALDFNRNVRVCEFFGSRLGD